MATIELLDPTMPVPARSRELAPRVDTPDGKTVGLRVRWTRFEVFMDRFEQLLQERYRPEGIIRLGQELTAYKAGKASPRADEFFERADWAVLGLAA